MIEPQRAETVLGGGRQRHHNQHHDHHGQGRHQHQQQQHQQQQQMHNQHQQQRRPRLSLFRRLTNCLCAPRKHQLRYASFACDQLLQSFFWKALIIFCTVLLLFGSPIQFAWAPKEVDRIFDIMYTVGFGLFVVDMILNLIVDPEYFGGRCRTKRGTIENPLRQQPKYWTCGLGSFLFWCDVLSTAAFFNDISYVNRREYSMEEIMLTLDQYGVPVSNTFFFQIG